MFVLRRFNKISKLGFSILKFKGNKWMNKVIKMKNLPSVILNPLVTFLPSYFFSQRCILPLHPPLKLRRFLGEGVRSGIEEREGGKGNVRERDEVMNKG